MNRPMSVSEYLTKTSAPAAAGRMARAWAATRGAAGRAGSHINANRLPYGLAAGGLGLAGVGAGLRSADGDYDTAGNVALGAGALAALGGAGVGAYRGPAGTLAGVAANSLRNTARRAGSHINANRLPYGLAAGALGAGALGAGLRHADHDTAGNVALGAGALAALGAGGVGAVRGHRTLQATKEALRGRLAY